MAIPRTDTIILIHFHFRYKLDKALRFGVNFFSFVSLKTKMFNGI